MLTHACVIIIITLSMDSSNSYRNTIYARGIIIISGRLFCSSRFKIFGGKQMINSNVFARDLTHGDGRE